MPSTGGGAGSQAEYAFVPRVLTALVVNLVSFAAVYSARTDVVPFLENVTGICSALASLFLLAYGAMGMVPSMQYREEHLHRLICGDHRPDHCGDLHPGRPGPPPS
ncbi:hypothetical protein [Streptomyces sp. NPDC002676]